ncbi:MAG: hypothetical protein WC389_00265 [Lutibacter sp.]|jgi:hypothetical protein
MANENQTSIEKQIGDKYAGLLQGAIRFAIQQESASFSTLALRTKVVAKIKDGHLQRLVLESPKHSFVHHYGFEGIRSNRRKLSLETKNHLSDLKQIAILNGLANEIGNLRADEVTAKINF